MTPSVTSHQRSGFAAGNTFSVVYERGSCLPGTPSCSCAHTGTKGGWSTNWTDSPQTQEVGAYAMPCDVTDESRVSRAAALAASADVTILVLGDGSTTSTAQNAKPYEREVATVGEHFDRDDLDPAVRLLLPLSGCDLARERLCLLRN